MKKSNDKSNLNFYLYEDKRKVIVECERKKYEFN